MTNHIPSPSHPPPPGPPYPLQVFYVSIAGTAVGAMCFIGILVYLSLSRGNSSSGHNTILQPRASFGVFARTDSEATGILTPPSSPASQTHWPLEWLLGLLLDSAMRVPACKALDKLGEGSAHRWDPRLNHSPTSLISQDGLNVLPLSEPKNSVESGRKQIEAHSSCFATMLGKITFSSLYIEMINSEYVGLGCQQVSRRSS